MKVFSIISTSQTLSILLTLLAVATGSSQALAWGHEGHGVIGILSLETLSTDSRLELNSVLGSLDDQTIIEACNWPDAVRKTDEWKWSYPQHFVNIPKGEPIYSKRRDCPDGLCATEALKKYAIQLGDKRASQQQRVQAFSWLCHLTGDLHQPLHAGYSGKAFDRGGNNVEITFNNEEMNLHHFWDRALIYDSAGDRQNLLKIVAGIPKVKAGDNWTPEMVNSWTEESHQLVENEMYPDDPDISQTYQDDSWGLLQHRLSTAAERLALILNTVL